jgi:hypothetical protein
LLYFPLLSFSFFHYNIGFFLSTDFIALIAVNNLLDIQKIKRLKDKEGQRKHRQQNLTNFDTIYKNREHIYKNSIEKCRFLKKLKEVLPRKIAPSGGRRENFGVFRVKNHDFTPKNHIFPILGGAREISAKKIKFEMGRQ